MIDKINLAILIYHIHNNLDYERCLSYFFINVVGPSRAYSRKTIEFFFSLKLNIFRNKINAVPEDQVKDLAEDFFGNTISSMLPSSNPGNAKVIKKNSKILEMVTITFCTVSWSLTIKYVVSRIYSSTNCPAELWCS